MKNSVLKLKSYKNKNTTRKNTTRKNKITLWKDIDPPKKTLKNYKMIQYNRI